MIQKAKAIAAIGRSRRSESRGALGPDLSHTSDATGAASHRPTRILVALTLATRVTDVTARVRLASAGPSDARTQGAELGGAKRKPEDAAARRPAARCAGAVAAVTLALLALAAAPANAATTRTLLNTFGSSGAGDGQLSNPQNIAVDQSNGDVYVADQGNNRIDKFDSSGNFLRAFGADVGGSGVDVCTSSCVAGTSGSAPGQFTTARFVAVDNSNGDVYVGDIGTNLVQKFDSSGNLVTSWGSGGQLDGSTATDGPFAPPISGIAVDSAGALDVIDFNNRLFQFAQDGTFVTDFPTARGMDDRGLAVDAAGDLFKVNGDDSVEEFTAGGASDIGQVNGGTNALALEPASGDLYVAAPVGPFGSSKPGLEHYVFPAVGQVTEPDGSTCTIGPSSPCQPTDTFFLSFAPAGVAVASASGDVYLSSPNEGRLSVYGPALTIPDVTTGAASALLPSGATLNGTVNPAGGPVTDCHFDYGTSLGYGQSVPCDQTPASIGSGTADVPVTADVSGLQPDTTYHFRLSAANANGSNQGQDQTFTTTGPPTLCSQGAINLAQTTATLDAQLNPHGFDTTYHFEYGTDTSYGTSVPVPDGDAGAGTDCTEVSADIAGLTSGATYHFRLVATNTQGTLNGPDATFTTLPPAQISGVFASDLTATAATLHATINPTGLDTSCQFQYGTDTSYGTSVPCVPADLGSGTTDVAVSQQITGLTANTEYHYRVLATNSLGSAQSPDHTFVYDTTGGGLPDDRAYEQVTPPQKNGALVRTPILGLLPRVADGGSRLLATSIQCFADAGSCNGLRGTIGSPYAFNRTAAGWVATALSPPAAEFSGGGNVQWYYPNTGTALFSVPTPPGGEDDWYVREPDGSFTDVGPRTPPAAGITPDIEISANFDATEDFSHLVWAQPPVWPFDASTDRTVYEYVGTCGSPTACQAAQPLLVGVGGPHDGPGSTDLISTCGTDLGGASNVAQPGMLSADGRTVFFTAFACASGSGANTSASVPADAIYARIDGELPTAHTVAISQRSPADCGAPSGCQSSPPGDARFYGASADATQAYFTSTQQLTDDAGEDATPGDSARQNGECSGTSGPNGCNLYLYDSSRPAGHELIAVSAGDTSGGGPRVRGVTAISADGTHAYFVAQGVLTAAPNAQGQRAEDGRDNLYLYERDAAHPDGRIAFITGLPQSDSTQWFNTGEDSNVTPDGRHLVFLSHGRLTPDDTSESGALQVFRYDAQTGALDRISIGERGFNDNGNRPRPTTCSQSQCSEDAGIASAISAFPRRDPTMSHDGAYVFFQSPVGLTPQALDDVQIGSDANGPVYAQNVYEWHAGHVSLISDGKDTGLLTGAPDVALFGADASGQNVFFTTADQLVPQDTDTELDFYDARVGGGFPFTPPPAPCSGDTCKPPPTGTPPDQTPGTAGFSGPGNPTPSHAGPKHHRKRKHRKRHRRHR